MQGAEIGGIDLIMIIDSQAVQGKLDQLWLPTWRLPKQQFEQWVTAASVSVKRRHQFFWMPSHDKKKGVWKMPTLACGDERRWRSLSLNAEADRQTAIGCEEAARMLRVSARERQRRYAATRAEKMLQRQFLGAGASIRTIPEVEVEERDHGWIFAESQW